MKFWKYQGCGNDIILFEQCAEEVLSISSAHASELCDRRVGIGADQVLVVTLIDGPDRVKVDVFNSDGSAGQVCGNGLRCAMVHVFRRYAITQTTFIVNSVDCPARYYKDDKGNGVAGIALAPATFEPQKIPTTLPQFADTYSLIPYPNRDLREQMQSLGASGMCIAVGVGNPHVLFIESEPVALNAVCTLGSSIENDLAIFPQRVNAHWCTIRSRGEFLMQTWERGAGHTPACGSGAFASALALERLGLIDLPVNVKMQGGTVRIERCEQSGAVLLRGPAAFVFEGTITLE